MPYFRWSGVDIIGTSYAGKVFAVSEDDLDRVLLKRGIARTHSKPTIVWNRGRITVETKIEFFRQVAMLVNAGILLPQALAIIQEQSSHVAFQELLQHLITDLEAGVSIEKACARHQKVFSYTMIAMIQVGNNAGKLSLALNLLATHLETMCSFVKKLLAAAILPAITFVVLSGIALVLLIAVVPMIGGIIESSGHTPSLLTQSMLSMSAWLQSTRALITLAGVSTALVALIRYNRLFVSRRIKDTILVSMPGSGPLVFSLSYISFFQSLSMLLESGMQLVPALTIAQQTIGNSKVQRLFTNLVDEIRAGSSLSQALMHHTQHAFSADVITMVRVGEESGTLPSMLNHITHLYAQALQRSIERISAFVQPCLIIMLGLLIGLLVAGLYTPIFNLASSL